MAGKATIRLVDLDDDDVAASAAAGIYDGDDEHFTVSLEMVEEHTTVSVGVVGHIAVHITVSLEIVVDHSTASLGQGGMVLCSTSQCPWGGGAHLSALDGGGMPRMGQIIARI